MMWRSISLHLHLHLHLHIYIQYYNTHTMHSVCNNLAGNLLHCDLKRRNRSHHVVFEQGRYSTVLQTASFKFPNYQPRARLLNIIVFMGTVFDWNNVVEHSVQRDVGAIYHYCL